MSGIDELSLPRFLIDFYVFYPSVWLFKECQVVFKHFSDMLDGAQWMKNVAQLDRPWKLMFAAVFDCYELKHDLVRWTDSCTLGKM